ncbi:MAG: hypothetical protein Q8P12_00345 [bacterium]|nr:hypothetical protein [bacterium]
MGRLSGLIFLLATLVAGSPAIAEEVAMAWGVKVVPFTILPSKDGAGCEAREDGTGALFLSDIECPKGDKFSGWEMSPKGGMIVGPSQEVLSQCLDGNTTAGCIEMDAQGVRLVGGRATKEAKRLGVSLADAYVSNQDGVTLKLYQGCAPALEGDPSSGTVWTQRLVYAVEVREWQDAWPSTKRFTKEISFVPTFHSATYVDGTKFPLGCDGKPVPVRPARKS